MANAVFNSFESYLSKDTFNKCEHNTFPLRQIINFTATYGALIPFFLEDCVPTDKFRIQDCICKIQALPMSNPIFNEIRFSTWFFFVPYQILWHKFHRFIDGGKDGTYTAEHPYILAKFSRNSLGDYLGFPIIDETGSTNDPIKVDAFPFAAYQSIYKHYFLNQDLQTTGKDSHNRSFDSIWFPADDNKFALHDGLNWIMDEEDTTIQANMHGDMGTGNSQLYDVDNSGSITSDDVKKPVLTIMRFHNFNKDYFTSAMFSPQRGPVQGVNAINPSNPFSGTDFDSLVNFISSKSKNVSGLSASINTAVDSEGYFNFGIKTDAVSTDPDHPNIPLIATRVSTQSPTTSEKNAFDNAKANLADFFNRLLQKQGSSAFTISDLMVASQIQLWLERNMQVKSQYDDFMRVHFGFAPQDENYHKPKYIGGSSQLINVSQVIQSSESNLLVFVHFLSKPFV